MARDKTIKILRTTKANLDTQKNANNLLAGEPYLITDEDRIAVGIGVNSYSELAKKSEVGGFNYSTKFLFIEDFLGGVTSDGMYGQNLGWYISGYGISINLVNDSRTQGSIRIGTISQSGSGSFWVKHGNYAPIFIVSNFEFECRIRFNYLIDPESIRFGLLDYTALNSQTEPSNGLYFEFIKTANCWKCKAANSATYTTVTTNQSPSSSSTYAGYKRFKIKKEGSSVYFYIDGTLVATITTNIPYIDTGLFVGIQQQGNTEDSGYNLYSYIDYFILSGDR